VLILCDCERKLREDVSFGGARVTNQEHSEKLQSLSMQCSDS
jgi:hypothetical protein